jgi:PIN domain nuclease of toxin-antitoxin system
VLLDTHVWIWAVDGGARLGPKTRRRLNKPGRDDAAGAAALLVSTASVFEIAALHTAGRLQFTHSVERWIRESIDRGRLRVVDVDRDIAVDAGLMPASALADPFDRCLVATAREYAVPLVTADRRILEYASRTGLVRTVDASQ